MSYFDHERLVVYQLSLEFVGIADSLIRDFPGGHAHLSDQLHRAATSITLNIAEGAGEFSKKDKARFYRMAMRSATECAAILDILRKLHLADELLLQSGRDLLFRIVSMLVRLVRSMVAPKTGTGTGTGKGEKG